MSSSAMHNQASSFDSSEGSPSMPYESSSRVPPSSTPSHNPLPRPTLRDLFKFSRSSSARSSSPQLFPWTKASEGTRRKIVGIQLLNSNNANLSTSKFLTGDNVKTVTGADNVSFSAPFPNGKHSLLGELSNFHNLGVNTLTIKVRRNQCEFARRALIVPRDRSFVLVDSDDINHEFIFEEYTEDTCLALQAQSHKDMLDQLSEVRVAACDVGYTRVENMGQLQNAGGISLLYSMSVVPRAYKDASTPTFSNVEETVYQATSWLHASQSSGVPLLFRNIQTEPLLTEDIEQNTSAYRTSIISTEARQPADCRAIRAIRIWFAFQFGEAEVELMARQGETLLGVTIGRTIEGFCHVTEVIEDTAADRAGLKDSLEAATALGMKLVVTRVGRERVVPWLIFNETIRCYDNSSISDIFLEHQRAGMPVYLHVVNWRAQHVQPCHKHVDPSQPLHPQ